MMNSLFVRQWWICASAPDPVLCCCCCMRLGRVLSLLWEDESSNLPPAVWRRPVPNMQGRWTNTFYWMDFRTYNFVSYLPAFTCISSLIWSLRDSRVPACCSHKMTAHQIVNFLICSVSRTCTWKCPTCMTTTGTSRTVPFAVAVERFCFVATPTAAGRPRTGNKVMHVFCETPPVNPPSSSRCFCVDCLDILVNPGASNNARYLDPWRCYMCQPMLQYGVLKRRHDWSLKLQEYFGNDNGQEFVSRHWCEWSWSTVWCFLSSLSLTPYRARIEILGINWNIILKIKVNYLSSFG